LVFNLLTIQQQEPLWVTILGVIFVFVCWVLFVLPRELKKKRKEDQEYADRKGISLEELRNLRAYRRARQIPKSTRKYVLQRDNYQCQYCGSQFNLEIDHIFPFSRGGGHEPENLQVLCKNCNLSKSNSV
jgi:5-methylcytosine-specific restriction enzyme A|tara:strand:- start:200 stop:589 length:390 start_codon:yes stop_codon:yes gene_type:complete